MTRRDGSDLDALSFSREISEHPPDAVITPTDLQSVIKAWSSLSEDVRQRITALVAEAQSE
jgi:hypothetical protein